MATTQPTTEQQPPAEEQAPPGASGAEEPTAENNAEEEEVPAPVAAEARLPTRKDVSLKDFLGKMDDYAPIVRMNRLSHLRKATTYEGDGTTRDGKVS